MSVKVGSDGTAVILGASGAVGKPLLALLVSEASPYSRVYCFARRAHPSPPAVSSNVEFKEVLVDFEKLHDGDAAEHAKLSSVSADAVFITMGTTRAAAGSMAAFERIDRGYVLSAAKALLSNPDNTKRTLLYCSSGSSSSSSLFPYLKSKGLTEEGLAKLCPHTIILRPGFLQHAQRQQTRLLERMFEPAMALAARFTDSAAAPVSDVAKAMLAAARKGASALKQDGLASEPPASFKVEGASTEQTAIVGNPAVLKLARQSE